MGAGPLRPAWCHPTEGRSLRASPEHGQLFPVSGSPVPRFPPYVVRPLHVHGAPAYGDDTAPDGKIVSCWKHPWETLAAQADLIWTHSGVPGRHWRSGRPRGGPRGAAEPNGGARQTLRTVRSGGHVCPEAYESLCIVNIEQGCLNGSGKGARQSLRTVWFWGHERPSAVHAATS